MLRLWRLSSRGRTGKGSDVIESKKAKGRNRKQQGAAAGAQVRGAAATSLLAPRRGLASAECKPGKAPKNVDYVGEPVRHNQNQHVPVAFLRCATCVADLFMGMVLLALAHDEGQSARG